MAKQFHLKKVTPLGDFDEKYGQRYWGETYDQLIPVMFNSMEKDIESGMRIEAEEILLKTSAKGTEYHGLKKVKILSRPNGAESTPQAGGELSELLTLTRENNKMLKQLTGEEPVEEPKEEHVETNDSSEEIDLNSIPF